MVPGGPKCRMRTVMINMVYFSSAQTGRLSRIYAYGYRLYYECKDTIGKGQPRLRTTTIKVESRNMQSQDAYGSPKSVSRELSSISRQTCIAVP